MSGVLVLLIPLRGRILLVLVALIALVGMVALLGWWTLLSALVALLLLAGGGWSRLQTVDHHSTGYGSEDQCACDQDRQRTDLRSHNRWSGGPPSADDSNRLRRAAAGRPGR